MCVEVERPRKISIEGVIFLRSARTWRLVDIAISEK